MVVKAEDGAVELGIWGGGLAEPERWYGKLHPIASVNKNECVTRAVIHAHKWPQRLPNRKLLLCPAQTQT